MNNCDYGHQTKNETRLLPIGGSGNIILCERCFKKYHYDEDFSFDKLRIYDVSVYNYFIHSKENYKKILAKGQNLRVILDYSRKHQISYIDVTDNLGGKHGTLFIEWNNGAYSFIDFDDYSVMINWLKSRKSWKGIKVKYNGFHRLGDFVI